MVADDRLQWADHPKAVPSPVNDPLKHGFERVAGEEIGGAINSPKHYDLIGGVDCIDFLEHFSFNCGTTMKYIWRAGKKGGPEKELEDLKKALWYLSREVDRLAKERADAQQ
jgi:hypothetical protein